MAKGLKLYEVHSFSTSPNSCQYTTLLNADVPHCYNAVGLIISIRLLTFASPIRQKAHIIYLFCGLNVKSLK